MQPSSRVANRADELTLDEAVHVLVGAGDPGRIAPAFLEDGFERRHNRGAILDGEHTCGTKRIGPRDTACDIVLEEGAIESERDAEIECRWIRSGIEAAGPQRHAFTSRA